MQPEVDLLVIGNLVMHDHSDLASRLDELEQRYEKIQIWQNIGVDPTGTLSVPGLLPSQYTIDVNEWPGNIDAIAVLHNVVPEDSPCVNAAGRTLSVTLSGADNRTYTLVDPLGVDNVPAADSDVVFFIITQTQYANLIDTDYILDRWQIIIGGGTGDVVGPAGATADNIAVFNGNTGKLIKDGGKKIADLVPSSNTTETPTASKIPIAKADGKLDDGWLTKNEWNSIPTATYSNTQIFTFTGTMADVLMYCRSLFRCRTVATAVTADDGTDKITHNSHGRLDGDMVIFGGTAAPTGLTLGQVYFIRDKGTNDYKVAATPGGVAIDLTSAGTSVTAQYVKIGYVDTITISGTTVTVNIKTETNLANTDVSYELTPNRKVYDYQEFFLMGVVECYADTTAPQGRWLTDTKQPLYLLNYNASVFVAATDAGASLKFKIYLDTTEIAESDDFGTADYLSPKAPVIRYIPTSSNITVRNTVSAGATLAQKLQVQLYLVPVNLYARG